MYKFIWGKTSQDIKEGKYKYAGTTLSLLQEPVDCYSDELYLSYFIRYENEFKRAKSLREFLKSNEDYPEEIFGKEQIMRLNPKPVHYEF